MLDAFCARARTPGERTGDAALRYQAPRKINSRFFLENYFWKTKIEKGGGGVETGAQADHCSSVFRLTGRSHEYCDGFATTAQHYERAALQSGQVPVAEALARYAINLKYEDLPHEVVRTAKRTITNGFSVIVAVI